MLARAHAACLLHEPCMRGLPNACKVCKAGWREATGRRKAQQKSATGIMPHKKAAGASASVRKGKHRAEPSPRATSTCTRSGKRPNRDAPGQDVPRDQPHSPPRSLDRDQEPVQSLCMRAQVQHMAGVATHTVARTGRFCPSWQGVQQRACALAALPKGLLGKSGFCRVANARLAGSPFVPCFVLCTLQYCLCKARHTM